MRWLAPSSARASFLARAKRKRFKRGAVSLTHCAYNFYTMSDSLWNPPAPASDEASRDSTGEYDHNKVLLLILVFVKYKYLFQSMQKRMMKRELATPCSPRRGYCQY